jgi:hypothetical protein
MRLMTPPLPAASRPLEQHDQFKLLVNDPILQFDQFTLQSQQFAEVGATVERFRRHPRRDPAHH